MVAAFMTTSSKAGLLRHGFETAQGGGCNTGYHIFILPGYYCCVSPALPMSLPWFFAHTLLFFLMKKQKSLREK
jgi:hypothetical protein